MIKSQHRSFYVGFFNIYTKLMIRRHFHKVDFRGEFNDKGLPLMMIGNHFSWWDGFIANFINLRILHRKIHVMMLEEQLAGRKFLNKAGAYSIRKKNRSAFESLRYSAELLSGKDNLVVLYPQGEFQSLFLRPVSFGKGVKVIISYALNDFQLIFYAALPEYFSSKRPSLTIYYAEADRNLLQNPGALENEYNRFLESSVNQQRPD